MKKIIIASVLIIFVFTFFQNCKKDDLKNIDCSTVSSAYNANIKPLVISQCATSSGCHGTGTSHSDYTTYAGLKAVADNGQLEQKALSDESMPPSGALSLDDRKKIKCWLNSGSPNN